MRISDWSSDVCPSDLRPGGRRACPGRSRLKASAHALKHVLNTRLTPTSPRKRRGDDAVDQATRSLRGTILSSVAAYPMKMANSCQVALSDFLAIGRASCRERVGQYV